MKQQAHTAQSQVRLNDRYRPHLNRRLNLLLAGSMVGFGFAVISSAEASECFDQARTSPAFSESATASRARLTAEQIVAIALATAEQGPIAVQGLLTLSNQRLLATMEQSNRTLTDALLQPSVNGSSESPSQRLEATIKRIQDELDTNPSGFAANRSQPARLMQGIRSWLNRSATQRIQSVQQWKGLLDERQALMRELYAENEALAKLAPALQRELVALRERTLVQIELTDRLQLKALDLLLSDMARQLLYQEIIPAESRNLSAILQQVQSLEMNETLIAQRMKANRFALEMSASQDALLALRQSEAVVQVATETQPRANEPAVLTETERHEAIMRFQQLESEEAKTCLHPFLCNGAHFLYRDHQGRARPREIKRSYPSLDSFVSNRNQDLSGHSIYITHPGLRFRGMKVGLVLPTQDGQIRIIGISNSGLIMTTQPGLMAAVWNRTNIRAVHELFFTAEREGLQDFVKAKYNVEIGQRINYRTVGYRVLGFRTGGTRDAPTAFLLEPVAGPRQRIVVPADQLAR